MPPPWLSPPRPPSTNPPRPPGNQPAPLCSGPHGTDHLADRPLFAEPEPVAVGPGGTHEPEVLVHPQQRARPLVPQRPLRVLRDRRHDLVRAPRVHGVRQDIDPVNFISDPRSTCSRCPHLPERDRGSAAGERFASG